MSVADSLTLADWRRTIAALYAEVRALSATDPCTAHEHWRATRERLYRDHPQSPIPLAGRAAFTAAHFPYDPALRFLVAVEAADEVTAPAAVGLTPVRGVAVREEEAAGVALQPVQGEPARAGRERNSDPTDAAKGHIAWTTGRDRNRS